MVGSKVTIPLDHSQRLPASKLLYCSQIDPGHHEPRRKRVAVAVPRVSLKSADVLSCSLHGFPGTVHGLGKELVGLRVSGRLDGEPPSASRAKNRSTSAVVISRAGLAQAISIHDSVS
jgi:hypothetical protein